MIAVPELWSMSSGLNDIELEAIKAMFETGKIKKMSQLEKLYPTKISRLLGINYGRYIEKLNNPEFFSLVELIKFAAIINIDFKSLVHTVVDEINLTLKKKRL